MKKHDQDERTAGRRQSAGGNQEQIGVMVWIVIISGEP
jgi:hypothetical protein